MKLNKLVSYLTLAGVCSTSLISLPVLAQEGAKDATAQTKSANDALYGQLPFTDKTDFMKAKSVICLEAKLFLQYSANITYNQ